MSGWARKFTETSAAYLRDTYVPRLETALRQLPPADLSYRPHDRSLSFETILRHLEGNVRQWILSGLDGRSDSRTRATEFTSFGSVDGDVLLDALRATVHDACAVIEGLDEASLLRSCCIQGFDTTGLEAVYHVVEHFSWHTGQAVWIAKARAGHAHGIRFYDDDAINQATNG